MEIRLEKKDLEIMFGRALEVQEILAIGENKEIKVDALIIRCKTKRPELGTALEFG